MDGGRLLFRRHAWERMQRRGIRVADVEQVIKEGDVIEDYPTDTPYPSALLFAVVNGRPLHVVRAIDAESNTAFVVTAYEPDPAEWDPTFRIRRQ